MFYDKDASLYIQKNMLLANKTLENEMRLINLLSKYGAKFSAPNLLLYDLDELNALESDGIDLPSDLFHPFDHISFKDVRLQSQNIVPIMAYLTCLLSVLKLNLPTMFLHDLREPSEKDALKQEIAYNLHDMLVFIQKNVIDSLEKKIYYENIQKAFELLSTF